MAGPPAGAAEAQMRTRLGVEDDEWLGAIDVDMNQKPLGEGSFGTVHKAIHDGRDVAVKVLHFRHTKNNLYLEKFGDERRILRRLSHPRLVMYIGIGSASNGSPSIVLELMEDSLAGRIQVKPTDAYVQKLRYLLDTAEALRYIHGRGLLHRDVKPGNVLITAGRAKLADVGLARFLQSNTQPLTRPLTRPCPGTKVYMAPECRTRDKPYGLPMDVYAMGLVILELMTGQREGMTGQWQADLARLPAGRSLRDLIVQCLQNDPSLRPTAEKLHIALMEISMHSNPDQTPPQDTTAVVQQLSVLTQLLAAMTEVQQQVVARLNATELRMAAMTEVQQQVVARLDTSELHMADMMSLLSGVRSQLATVVGRYYSALRTPRYTFELPEWVNSPWGAAINKKGHMAISCPSRHCIVLQVFPAGTPNISGFHRIIIYGKRGSNAGEFRCPSGVWFNDDGNIVVADTGNDRVQVLNPEGQHISTYGGVIEGTESNLFKGPYGVKTFQHRKKGQCFLVVDANGLQVVPLSKEAAYRITTINEEDDVQEGCNMDMDVHVAISHVAISHDQRLLFVAQWPKTRIQVFTVDGDFQISFSLPNPGPPQFSHCEPEQLINPWWCFALDQDGNVLLADMNFHRVLVLSHQDYSLIATIEPGSVHSSDVYQGGLQWIAVALDGRVHVVTSYRLYVY